MEKPEEDRPSLECIEVQFGGKSYYLIDEEGITYAIRPGKTAIKVYTLDKVLRKFVIRYREREQTKRPTV